MMFWLALCLCLVTPGSSVDDQCELNDGDCISTNPFSDVYTKDVPDIEIPHVDMQRSLVNNPEAKACVESALLVLENHVKDNITSNDIGYPLCYKKTQNFVVPSAVYYHKGWCWMHWYFNRLQVQMAVCSKRACRNLPCENDLYHYQCYPANFKSIKLWMYCPHLKPNLWWPFYRRVPTCCECRRSLRI